jgi:hypothetical protein
MLDIMGAIFATGLYATAVGVLIGLSPVHAVTRLVAFAAAAAWLGIIVAVAALGGLAPGVLGPIPANLLPFAELLALLFGGWFLVPRFRSALLSVPLPALIAVHAGRLGGLFFLLLHADGRLSAPFAPAAGVGDMVTGGLAIPLAAMLMLGFEMRRPGSASGMPSALSISSWRSRSACSRRRARRSASSPKAPARRR